jgi:hypothetical protein
MNKTIYKQNDQIELKILAIKVLPLMTGKLESTVEMLENATGYPHYKLLLKQIQFIYAALGITDEASEFLNGKLIINAELKAIFKNYLLEALKQIDAPLSKIRIISQRIAQIKTSES